MSRRSILKKRAWTQKNVTGGTNKIPDHDCSSQWYGEYFKKRAEFAKGEGKK